MSSENDVPMKTLGSEEEKNRPSILFGSESIQETKPETKATIDGWWVAKHLDVTSLVCAETQDKAVWMFRTLNRISDSEEVDIVPATCLPMSGDDAIHCVERHPIPNDKGVMVDQLPLVYKSSVTAIPTWIEWMKSIRG